MVLSTGQHQIRVWKYAIPAEEIVRKKLVQVSTSPYAPGLKSIFEDEFRRSLKKGEGLLLLSRLISLLAKYITGILNNELLKLQQTGKMDVNSPDRSTGETALHIVCHRGDPYVLQVKFITFSHLSS